ncbi:NucA/NucB deoxyribonuclease domain-containing protein [Streptomyces sp. NPDC051207]|uniref:NucA/NucB deoxyribonuclease domain-containing protein n=1 Tax=Streptomyces sp. NPDC051207 TaxID=3154641 RepID=UPI0034442C4E
MHRNVPTGTWGTFSPDSDAVAAANESAKNSACASLTRPADHDCDEFSFASTKEGAGVGDGNFSVPMVPSTENRSAGG